MKKIIAAGIQEASDTFEGWLGQAQLLVDGKSTHLVRKPVSCKKCEFGRWLYSEEHVLKKFSWFHEIKELHQAFHDAYDVIYNGANEVYDAKTLAALKSNFHQLESQSDLLVTKLEEIKSSSENTEESISGDDNTFIHEEGAYDISSEDTAYEKPNQEKQTFQTLRNDDELSPSIMSAQIDAKQLEMHKKLKKLDLEQLEQEQKLTEQELQQLEDRQKLTSQGVDQIIQYQQLKNDEITQQLMEHQKLEDGNSKAKALRTKELSSVRHNILLKHDELEQLKLVDQKLENRKAEEQKKEQAILDNFERKQFADKQDIIELEQQRKKWENEVVKLQQQLLLVEQDIDDLVEQQKEKQAVLDDSNRQKELKLKELEEYSQQQEVLNGHKSKVREAKQEELAQLEQEKSLFKQEVAQLDAEAEELKNQKIEMNKQHKRDLKELDEQQRFKKMSMDKLDKDKNRKIQELKELVYQQEAIKKSLSEMEQQNDSETELEKA